MGVNKTEIPEYKCQCGEYYDGSNCTSCGYLNDSGIYPGETRGEILTFSGEQYQNRIQVGDILNQYGKEKGVLTLEVKDVWGTHEVLIDYEIALDKCRPQIRDDINIRSIGFNFKKETSTYLKELIEESDINIEDEIRKVFYGYE